MTLSMTRAARLAGALALLYALASPAQAVVMGPGAEGRYDSTGGTPFGTSAIPVELIGLSLVSSGPATVTPAAGGDFQVDSFFDVFIAPTGGDFQVDSFFDVFVELSVDGVDQVDSFFDVFVKVNVTPQATGTDFDTEIVSMSLTGRSPSGPYTLRESPGQPSTGQTSLSALPGGDFQVDSFFDVFVELSLDGAPFAAGAGPVQLKLTGTVPEPATLALLLAGIAGLARRSQRAARRR